MTSFINDNNQELVIEQEVLFTKQVATFKNFKIKGDVTVSFTVPNNSASRKVLGYYGYNQIDSPIFTENYFSMLRNGNEIAKGKLVIEQDSGEELSLFFISGNGNWFNLFQFSCKDIRNTSLQMQANARSREISWGVTTGGGISNQTIEGPPRDYGIVFPLIDPAFKNERHSLSRTYNFGQWQDNLSSDLIPCLYLHTLLNEISKVAGVVINGDIIEDKFFRTLTITPEQFEIYDGEALIDLSQYAYLYTGGDFIKIESIVPDIKSIEIIKWICISFGCVPIYDIYSKTLTLNQIDKFNKEDAVDWSDYVKSYTIYNDVNQNNYITQSGGDEDKIAIYNESANVKYGDLNIQSDKVDGSEVEVYKSPFAPCYDLVNTSGDWAFSCYIPFIELSDKQSFEYTSVTDASGIAVFNGAFTPIVGERQNVFFVVDNSGTYNGYHIQGAQSGVTSTLIESNANFISDSSGTLYIQTISYGNPGSRIISVIPRINISQFTNKTELYNVGEETVTVAMIAYWHKPYTQYSLLNGIKQGLSYGEIEGRNDITLQEKYLKNVSEAIKKPRLRANMLLPEAVVQKFNFDKFVYLNTGKLNGYFLVESIVNYKDSKTLVEVNLYG